MKFNNYIVIKYSDQEILLKTVQDFANLYHSQMFSNDIKVCSEDGFNYALLFNDIDEEHFLYAVNYLRYPESKAEFSSVFGYIDSKQSMYFVPASDIEYDNCYSVTKDGRCTKHVFDGSSVVAQIDQQYIEQSNDVNSLNIISTIKSAKQEKKGILSWLFG